MTSELTSQHKNIGKIIVAFNSLDLHLNSFIGWLINESDVGIGQLATSAIQSTQSRLDLFFVLYKYQASQMNWFPDISKGSFKKRDSLVKEASELKLAAENINQIRNRIVHSYWFQQQRHLDEFGNLAKLTGLRIKHDRSSGLSSGKVGLEYEVISFSKKELAAFLKQINSFTKKILLLHEKTKSLQKARSLPKF